ncbi:hypothetical protein FB446DRAFT_639122, partial [Lentinula raphanica]
HRIKRGSTCPCCRQHPETVFHYHFQCSAHRLHWNQFHRRIGQRNINLAALLTEKDLLKHLFHFINETKWFHHIWGDFPRLADED